MQTYPSSLPGPLVDGYSLSPVDQTSRTEMEVGAARVRRRTTARNDLLDASFCFSDSQFSAFRAWFDDSLTGISGGASWFFMSVNVGGGSTTKEVRFKGAWKAAKEGLVWKVSAQIEVR